MPLLQVNNISKEYDLGISGKFLVFKDISFQFNENERCISVLAPFGSGKSTLLKCICGLETLSSGEILLNSSSYSTPSGKIVYIPEKGSSLPWLNVKENISAVSQKNTDQMFPFEKIIDIVGLRGYEDHIPDPASRGFRFRIELGKALAVNPALILIDDCLKFLDKLTKSELYGVIKRVIHDTNIGILLASTDIADALELSDRIIFMSSKPAQIIKEFHCGENQGWNVPGLLSEIREILNRTGSDKSINFTL